MHELHWFQDFSFVGLALDEVLHWVQVLQWARELVHTITPWPWGNRPVVEVGGGGKGVPRIVVGEIVLEHQAGSGVVPFRGGGCSEETFHGIGAWELVSVVKLGVHELDAQGEFEQVVVGHCAFLKFLLVLRFDPEAAGGLRGRGPVDGGEGKEGVVFHQHK